MVGNNLSSVFIKVISLWGYLDPGTKWVIKLLCTMIHTLLACNHFHAQHSKCCDHWRINTLLRHYLDAKPFGRNWL
jgi:hypothetical protein